MSSVSLYVYDITQGMAKGMSMMLIGQQIDAIYHTSLVVFGKEYYFGAGICADPPKTTPFGKPIQQIPLEPTQIPKEIYQDYLKDIAHKYTQQKYDVINHNCNMFTNDIAQFLTGKGIGEKYVDQAKKLLQTPMGQMIKPLLYQMQGSIQNPQPGYYY